MTAGLSVDSDGFVSVALSDKAKPFTIKGKRVVIPTKTQLLVEGWDSRIAFHLLKENILRGETDVFSRYRKAITQRLDCVVLATMSYLLEVALNVDMQKKLKTRQTKFLAALKHHEVDAKTLDNFNKLTHQQFTDASHKSVFVSSFIKRNGKYKEVNYSRVCNISFPLYEMLEEADDNKIGKVKLRIKDVFIFKALLEYIFPNIKDEGSYNAGSDSKIAPYLQSLLLAMRNLIKDTNEVANTFLSKNDENYDMFAIRDDWFEMIDDLSPLLNEIRMIPSQEVSDVDSDEVETEEVAPKAVSKGLNKELQNFDKLTPVMNNEVPKATATRPKTIEEIVQQVRGNQYPQQYPNQGYPQQFNQPMYPQQYNQFQQAMPQYPNQGYPQQMNGWQQPMGYPNPYQPQYGNVTILPDGRRIVG